MKFWPALFLLLTLAACGAPSVEEAGPPPADYKDVIKANMPQNFNIKDPSPYPAGSLARRIQLANHMDDDYLNAYELHNVQISEPQPGRLEFIPGWRVCISAQFKKPDYIANPNHPNPYKGPDVYPDTNTYSDPHVFAYFFVKGSLQSIVPEDAPCSHYKYEPWPEMNDIGQQIRDRFLHPKWEYSTAYDYMSQTTTALASLYSKNEYNLRFPYAGGTHAIIGIVSLKDKNSVKFALDRGQVQCTKVKTCSMRVRFDSDPVETIDFAYGENNDRTSVFFEESDRVIARLKASHAVVIEIPVVNNGIKQFIFSSAGLDLGKLGTSTITEDPFAPAQDITEQNGVTGMYQTPPKAK